MESSNGFGPKNGPKISKVYHIRLEIWRKVIIVWNDVCHVTDHKLNTFEYLSQRPSGDPALQVQSSSFITNVVLDLFDTTERIESYFCQALQPF